MSALDFMERHPWWTLVYLAVVMCGIYAAVPTIIVRRISK